MVQVFAPSRSRVCSWILALSLTVAFAVSSLFAQNPPPPASKGAGPDAKAKPDDKPSTKPATPPAEPEDDEPVAEVFVDPLAKELMLKFDVLTYRGSKLSVRAKRR